MILVETLKCTDHSEAVGVKWSVKLKWILLNSVGGCRLDSSANDRY
jgi:hypothetical protein